MQSFANHGAECADPSSLLRLCSPQASGVITSPSLPISSVKIMPGAIVESPNTPALWVGGSRVIGVPHAWLLDI